MFGLGKKSAELPAFEPWDVLMGLAPSLVEDLAQLSGSTADDLLVSFQVMPYGDRATLAAYGLIEMDRSETGRRRVTRVSSAAVELVNLAAEHLAAEGTEDSFAARALEKSQLLASAAVPWVHVVSSPSEADGIPYRGVVVSVESEAPHVVQVGVPLLEGQIEGETFGLPVQDIQISPEQEIGGPGTQVVLIYESAHDPLAMPRAVAVEEVAKVEA